MRQSDQPRTVEAMASFTGDAERKARFLRELLHNGGIPWRSAALAGIALREDHEGWMAEDALYRRAFAHAKREGEQRLEQHFFNMICEAVRNGDRTSANWIRSTCGAEILETVQRGENPRWKRA